MNENAHANENPDRFNHLVQPSKTREQMAGEYGISPRTLRRRLKRVGLCLPNGVLFPEQQRLVYEKLGSPF
jgi:AraC-like DNA-binding protein